MNRSMEQTLYAMTLVDRRKQRLETRFAGAPMLRDVVEAMSAPSPDNRPRSNALRVARRVLAEGRAVLQGSQAPGFAFASLEQELSRLLDDFSLGKVRCEISVTGHRRELKPEVQEQIKLITREALGNAFRHSGATLIEAEIEYSARRLRLIVRDNGRGIEPGTGRDVHWGLRGMRERAESIGAKLTIWSRAGAGTEVEISVPGRALADDCG
jgi:signal transduction histidine kinase